MKNSETKDIQSHSRNTVLDDVFVLVNPEKFDIEKAFIKPWRYPINSNQKDKQNGFYIKILFKNGDEFYDSSDTVLGCKQHFAFRCSIGAIWEKQNII